MPSIDITQKRKNPVVDQFVTTDIPLRTILQATPEPRSPVAEATLQMEECLNGKCLAKDAIRLAQQVPLKGTDPELLILMLGRWAELSCRIGRPSEAEAFLHRAKALISDATHPEIKASVMLIESIVADTLGNQLQREKILRAILEMLPPYSPRRKFYLWEIALLLAQQGRGNESNSEIKEMSWQCNDRFPMSKVLLAQFINKVETGQIQEASRLLPQIATEQRPVSTESFSLRTYQALLKLMHGGVDPELLPGSKPSPDVPNSVRIARSLLLKDTNEALRLARMEASKLRGSIFGTGFDSFGLIRAELASENADSAIRLLKIREGRGNKHYMDDLFLARAHRLLKNTREASRAFASLLESVERYEAKGRLDFELKLSCELSQGDILKLTQSADKIFLKQKESEKTRGESSEENLDATMALPSEALGIGHPGMNMILGSSTAISEIREAITRFADIDAPVLITGETGVGKDLVARALHEVSRRRRHPFTPVNCGSLTETLLESELFGHERGAFTGAEKASKGLFEETGFGTILLDEIGDISPRLQSTLLRVLETGEIRSVGSAKTRKVSCRIIAATNVDLELLAEQGLFRKDLLFRLQRLLLYVPRLKERRNDILILGRHFLDLGRRIGIHATMSKDLREALRSYDWPGNVRELKNVIERMRLMHSDKLWYDLDDVDLKFQEVLFREDKSEDLPAPKQASSSAAPPPRDESRSAGLEPSPAPAGRSVGDYLRTGRSRIRRSDHLRDLFLEHKKLTRGEVVDLLGISANTATKYLKELCDEAFIDRIEPSASTRSHYFVLRSDA